HGGAGGTNPTGGIAAPGGDGIAAGYLVTDTFRTGTGSLSTAAASDVTPFAALLHGTVDSAAAPLTLGFQITTTPGNYSDRRVVPSGSLLGGTGTPVSAAVTGLSPETTYYYRLVAVIDSTGETLLGNEQSFTTSADSPPTAISLSPGSVAENKSAGTTVGKFSTTDPDAGDTFTYTLLSGTDSFTIDGN